MRVLGVDPGSRTAGFGIIECSGRKIHYVDSGILKFQTSGSFLSRLAEIYEASEQLVHRYKPTMIVLESLIQVRSVTALAKLAQARGAMLAAFAKTHDSTLFEYSPNLIKSVVSGHGHASKEGMKKAVSLILGRIDFKTHDESDALAIALCHALGASGRGGLVKGRSGSLASALSHKIKDAQ